MLRSKYWNSVILTGSVGQTPPEEADSRLITHIFR
jgi:hypothetical protein